MLLFTLSVATAAAVAVTAADFAAITVCCRRCFVPLLPLSTAAFLWSCLENTKSNFISCLYFNDD
jgi:hypothetical protein